MKPLTLALLGSALFVAPVYAATTAEVDAKIKADEDAIIKDQEVLKKDQAELERDRAAKAQAKVTKDYGTQAKKSVEIGADKTMIKEKQAEKSVDQKILNHDVKEASPAAGNTDSDQ